MKHVTIACFLLCTRLTIAQESDLQFLLNQVEEQINRLMDYEAFSARVITESSTLDKNWKPQKTVVVEKILSFTEDFQEETIINAVERQNGNEKDVTQQHRDQEVERRKKAKRKRLNEEKSENEESGAHLNIKELFPFTEVNKRYYNFYLKSDTAIDGKNYYCLQTEAKEKSKDIYEGIYIIDSENYYVEMFEVKPSQNPSCVKDLTIRITFDLADEKYLVPTHFWMRVYADLWIKKIRREETMQYTNYQFGDEAL